MCMGLLFLCLYFKSRGFLSIKSICFKVCHDMSLILVYVKRKKLYQEVMIMTENFKKVVDKYIECGDKKRL